MEAAADSECLHRPFGLPCLLVVLSVTITCLQLRWAWAGADRAQKLCNLRGVQETFY